MLGAREGHYGVRHPSGRVANDVHPPLDGLLRLRARKQLRDRFGDVDQARDVLRALTALLDELDDPTFDGPVEEEPATKRHRDDGPAAPTPSS